MDIYLTIRIYKCVFVFNLNVSHYITLYYISVYSGLGGVALGYTMIYYGLIHNPLVYLIIFAATYSSIVRLIGPRFGWVNLAETRKYYNTTRIQTLSLLFAYIGLILVLIISMLVNNKYRLTPQHIKAIKEGKVTTPTFGDSGDPWLAHEGGGQNYDPFSDEGDSGVNKK